MSDDTRREGSRPRKVNTPVSARQPIEVFLKGPGDHGRPARVIFVIDLAAPATGDAARATISIPLSIAAAGHHAVREVLARAVKLGFLDERPELGEPDDDGGP